MLRVRRLVPLALMTVLAATACGGATAAPPAAHVLGTEITDAQLATTANIFKSLFGLPHAVRTEPVAVHHPHRRPHPGEDEGGGRGRLPAGDGAGRDPRGLPGPREEGLDRSHREAELGCAPGRARVAVRPGVLRRRDRA